MTKNWDGNLLDLKNLKGVAQCQVYFTTLPFHPIASTRAGPKFTQHLRKQAGNLMAEILYSALPV